MIGNKNKYKLKIFLYEGDRFRIYVQNTHQKDPQFSLDDLIGEVKLNPINISHQIIVQQQSNQISFNYNDNTTIIIYLNPFTVLFRWNNSDVISVKPFFFNESNPSSIIRYYKSQYLSGIPSHADSLLLRDTIRDRPYQLYNQDRYLWPVNSRGGMYGGNPVLFNYGTYGQTCLYWRNVSETYFDISSQVGSCKREVMVMSEVNDLDFILTLNCQENVQALYKKIQPIIGSSFLPPLWSLCYQHSRYSFMSSDDLMETEAGFDYHKIPIDAFYLDLHHTDEMKYFTWNPKTFPNPEKLLDHFHQKNRWLVTIQDPHLKRQKGYRVYDEFKQQELIVKIDDKDFMGKAWPGESVYVDFVDEDAQELWAQQYDLKKYINSERISVWNDLNEPTVQDYPDDIECMPKNCQHKLKLGQHKIVLFHKQIRLCYGYLQMKSTFNGLNRRDQNSRRNIAFTRSFFTGIQKYAIVWTADAESTFKYLNATTPMLLSYSMVGMSFNGGDIPGFMYHPKEDLCRRWYQLGAFQPFFRSHSNLDTQRREPWLFSEETLLSIRQSVLNRYELLPYWYDLFNRNHITGMPVLRPLWMRFQDIEEIYIEEQIHCVGDALIIVPITSRNQNWIKLSMFDKYKGILYDYWTGCIINTGVLHQISQNHIPVFVIGGHIIPTYDIGQKIFNCSKQLQDQFQYHLKVYLNTDSFSSGSLYIDDGITNEYQKGVYLQINFEFNDGVFTFNSNLLDDALIGNPLINKLISKITIFKSQEVLMFENLDIKLLQKYLNVKLY